MPIKKLLKKISLNLSKSFQKEIKKLYNNSTLRLVPKKNLLHKSLITPFIIILRQLNHDNYILITIQGKGEQAILSSENSNTLPYSIEINGNAYTDTIGYTVKGLISETNDIKMTWNT